ncbi:MAG: hypothetical protein KGR26_14770, partial [Cyanobacteria bacterium REEB65]|nr:hypothetical protein [Cyanobacteria bacterium REEB65]
MAADRQRGAALIIVALLALGLLAATGLAADAGMMYYQRTRMQVAADAAALAGARGLLQDQASATAIAEQYAQANGYPITADDISFPSGTQIHVDVHGPAPLLLGELLGIATPDIAASSSGELHSVGTAGGIRPFGIPDQSFQQGREYLLKVPAGCSTAGNFQALAIDGPGASVYEQDILNGSAQAVSVGQQVETQPGDMVGPTDAGVNQLVAGDQTTFEQALQSPGSTPRVITVALLDPSQWSNAHGRSTIGVTGFAQFYVIDAQTGAVDARFMDRVSTQTLAGT